MNSMPMRRPLFGTTALSDTWFDNFFADFFDKRAASPFSRSPSTDIAYADDGTTLYVDMEVPGYSRDDIKMSVTNGVLEIHGEKHGQEEQGDSKRSYAIRETASSFARRIVLPDGADSDKIAAEMENGVLSVTIPIEQAEARRIEIAAPKHQPKARLASLTGTKSETQ